MTIAKRRQLWLPILILLSWHGLSGRAEGCALCWAGYGKGDERLNKPLADLRIIYEKEGRNALPYIRDTLETSTDPLVIRRAANYIVEFNDRDSIPLLEDMLLELTRRVSFSAFGLDTYAFKCRLAAAHALGKLGHSNVGSDLWERYDHLDFKRRSEVPYILNALNDPHLDERLLRILDVEEDHQLMMGALDALAVGGSAEAIPALKTKVAGWHDISMKASDTPDQGGPVNYDAILKIKGQQALFEIEARGK
jgi:hypothetical protein